MLERMESPKLRSFEEVPYVEKRRCGITSVSNVFFRPPSHFLAIRAVTGVVFGARLLGRLIS
jgi:hypothetical protein